MASVSLGSRFVVQRAPQQVWLEAGLLEQALDLWLAHLRALADNLFVYADLERPAIRAAEATWVQLDEQVDALVHSGSLSSV